MIRSFKKAITNNRSNKKNKSQLINLFEKKTQIKEEHF